MSEYPTAPQMRLPCYFQDEAADRVRWFNMLLRPDSPPVDRLAQTRFVVRKSASEIRPTFEWACVAAVFEPMALTPRASFSLTDSSPPVQWLTGRFQFKEEPSGQSLEFVGEQRSFQTYANDFRSKVKEGAIYRVAVKFEAGWAPAIERILLGEEVIYDRSICTLHGVKMTRFDVPIIWGSSGCDPLPSANGAPLTREQWAEFPNYTEQFAGGCVVYPDSSDTLAVYICPRCRAAFLAWRARHGR